ncbi:Aldo/keto reductase [Rhizodiscina lignyota]|uniref:Aldo/keto reductase n=1 Tax=Rhizodiscina lignyota TaxID=1504668 RepID=A0A9P4I4Y1_9PEZI|nr:Aldo/keto reductase [Rhizodiscina lignyota]
MAADDKSLPLRDSPYRIPQLGFGVYKALDDVCYNACLAAFKAGYRHIDSAQMYANEAEVGRAVNDSGLKRSEIFVTTKIMFPGQDEKSTYEKVMESVKKAGGEGNGGHEKPYVDLFLVHNPNGGRGAREMMWKAIERAKKEGYVRNIGVSNYGKPHIEEMKEYTQDWPPAVNQIELHPWCQQRKTVEYCHSQGIVIQAYCPLVRNRRADDPTLNALVKKYPGKTQAQLLIKYALQKGWVPLPKTATPSRIEENADVYGWEISEEDMHTFDALDEGRRGSIVTFCAED